MNPFNIKVVPRWSGNSSPPHDDKLGDKYKQKSIAKYVNIYKVWWETYKPIPIRIYVYEKLYVAIEGKVEEEFDREDEDPNGPR